ncbi:type VII secretion AAA-ATPase EccA [Mycobacterium sp. TY815]|uniref:type VII secretion AAA-ATPase EccA n=1 Tax=Mycobacterium sp. TY815 TaxID=3050581 RepID=UPI002741A46E|nr:type VII secretion AAA-ATPase EccA [Mycobacterium sp. TY815]MDP7707372.1 type VII secretion AAA-ATPase EccA [Mycobacterium sp. TY815]
MSVRTMEALRAGIKALSINPRRALDVLRLATDEDPAMADAWLGRVAAGDRSMSTLAGLSAAAARFGQDLMTMGVHPKQLAVSFDVGYVRLVLDDGIAAKLAHIAALLAEREFEQANALLDSISVQANRVTYVRAQLMHDTERWPDLLAAVTGCQAWSADQYLMRAASLLEGKAAANLGLFDRALSALTRASESSLTGEDPVVRDALYLRALIARCQGQEDEAQHMLADVVARWPEFAIAKQALADPTYSLHIVDHVTIDSRTDRWDPATQTTPAQRAAADRADAARKRMADAEQSLANMVGLDDVKRQIASLKASTITRILRQRKGIPTPVVSRHMLMVGPPGVGKTESARAIAKIFCGLGILPRPDVYETKKDSLTGQYVGDVEVQTREFLSNSLGATVFFDEFGDLAHGGYAHGDPIGQAIIGVLVPWMENHRDEAVLIAAGYPRACERVLGVNAGLRGRFATTIAFESYQPDKLIAIAQAIITRGGDIPEPGALEAVLTEPFTRFYNQEHRTEDNDIVRTIDTLGNGRFVRNIVEAAQKVRDERIVDAYGLHHVDLTDDNLGEEITDDAMSLLTGADLAHGLQEALPPALRERSLHV